MKIKKQSIFFVLMFALVFRTASANPFLGLDLSFQAGVDPETRELIRALPNNVADAYIKALKATGAELEHLTPVLLNQVVQANQKIADTWGCKITGIMHETGTEFKNLFLGPRLLWSRCEKDALAGGQTPSPFDYLEVERCEKKKFLTVDLELDQVLRSNANLENRIVKAACAAAGQAIEKDLLLEKAETGVLYKTWSLAERTVCINVKQCAPSTYAFVKNELENADPRDFSRAKELFDTVSLDQLNSTDFAQVEAQLRTTYIAHQDLIFRKEYRSEQIKLHYPGALALAAAARAAAQAFKDKVIEIVRNTTPESGMRDPSLYEPVKTLSRNARNALNASSPKVSQALAFVDPQERKTLSTIHEEGLKYKKIAEDELIAFSSAIYQATMRETGRIKVDDF